MTFVTYTDNVLVEGHENVHHFEAAEDVLQGQVVELDSDNAGRTVEPHDQDGAGPMYGVALYDQSSGAQVAVAGPGAIVRGVSGTGSISSGDFVTGEGSTGEAGEVMAATSGDRLIGVALQDDTGTGTEGSIVFQVIAGQFGD